MASKSINVILSLKDRFTSPVKKASEATGRLAKKLSRSSEQISRLEKSLNNTAVNIARKLPKLAAASVAGLAGGAAAVLESTEELRNSLARLEANAKSAGIGISTTNQAMQELSKFSKETDSNVEALSNLMAAGLDEKQMMRALDSLSGAAIKFSDTLKIEGLADGFEETLATGMGVGPFGELIERLGYNLDDFNAGLQQAKKSGTELEYVLDFLDKTGLSKVKETYEKTNADLVAANKQSYAFQQRMAKLGGVLQPVANRLLGITQAGNVRKNSLLDLAGRGIDKLTAKLQQWEQNGTLDRIGQKVDQVFFAGAKAASFFADHIGIIGPIVAGLATGLGALNIISTVTKLFAIANPPMLIIAASIAAVTAAIILLRQNWDKITGAIGSGVQFVQGKLQAFAKLLASIKVPQWLTDLSKKVAGLGSQFGQALNKANKFIFGADKAMESANRFGGATNGGGSGRVPGHATGTPYFAGGLTRINEGDRGEIVELPSGTKIIPHDISKQAAQRQRQYPTVQKAVPVTSRKKVVREDREAFPNPPRVASVTQEMPETSQDAPGQLQPKSWKKLQPYFSVEKKVAENTNTEKRQERAPRQVPAAPAVTVNVTIQGNVIGNEQYAQYIGDVIGRKIKMAYANL